MDSSIPFGLSIAFNVGALSISIVVLILYSLTLNNSQKLPYDFLRDLKENWSNNYMTDIISTDLFVCPSDYEVLLVNKWPGTKDGCLCSTVVYIGNCKEIGKDSDPKCQDVSGIDSVKWQTWNNKRLCVKRGNTNYFNLQVAQTNCPANFPKKCGIIDSLNNILCVGQLDNCPINDIKIMDKLAIFNTNSQYQSFSLTDKKLLYTFHKTDGIIPTIIKISDEIPCINPKFENYYMGQSYVLDNYFTKETCSEPLGGLREDMNYQRLDSYPFKMVLRENGIYNLYSKIANLPMFPKDRFNHTSSLFSRGYYGMQVSCRNSFSQKVTDVPKYLQSLEDISDYAMTSSKFIYGAQIPIIIQLVIVCFWFLINMGNKTNIELFYDYSSIFSKIIVLMFLFAFVITVITLGLVGGVITNFSKLESEKLVFLSGCLDVTSEILLTNFIQTTNRMKSYGVGVPVLLGINLLILSLEFFFWRCGGSCGNVEESGHIKVSDDEEGSKKNENHINTNEIQIVKAKRVIQKDKNSIVSIDANNDKNIKLNEDRDKENEVTKTPNKPELIECNGSKVK